ncbi:MAG TPA: AraC family transcriptional regulator [Stellaceae bacterium]|nr:AraC family transcriptional regulator [Stellaceae bacterium]
MADGDHALLAADRAHAPLRTTVWNAPDVHIERARSWQRLSATIFSRGAGVGFWRSDQYRLSLYLTDIAEGTVQIDNGRAQLVKAAAPRPQGFLPKEAGMMCDIPPARLAQIIQSPDTYSDLAAEIGAPIRLDDLEPILTFDDPASARLIQAIVNEIDSGLLDHVLVDALNTALAVTVVRRFHGSAVQLLAPGRLSRARLRRVLDYIEDRLEEPLSLSELAAIACLSPFHFSRCFKRSMGMGLRRYVVQQRIKRARRLILETDRSLADIAAATGFDSQASFTFRFGREVGMSPGRLRRERA